MNREDARVILRDYISPRDTAMVAFVTCRPGSVEIDKDELLHEIAYATTPDLSVEDIANLLDVYNFVFAEDLDSE